MRDEKILRDPERFFKLTDYSIKITSGGKGKSAVGAAAYRAGERIKNEYDGVTHDYTHKGGVVFRDILLAEKIVHMELSL